MPPMIPRGFTLIELLVTLSVVTILATVAIPSFRTLIDNNRAATASNDLLASLLFARSEAVKRATTVTVCPNGEEAFDPADPCPVGTDWQAGWVVFWNDGGVDTLLRKVNALQASVTITGPTLITYAQAGSSTPGNVLITVGVAAERRVCLEASGRTEVRKEPETC